MSSCNYVRYVRRWSRGRETHNACEALPLPDRAGSSPSQVFALMEALQEYAYVTHLDLSYNQLDDAALATVVRLLKYRCGRPPLRSGSGARERRKRAVQLTAIAESGERHGLQDGQPTRLPQHTAERRRAGGEGGDAGTRWCR
jgi:hypothetical protein